MECLEIDTEEEKVEEEANTEESFESQISKEVTDLKDVSDKPFVAIEPCGLQCVVFIRTRKGVDPIKLTEKIFEMIGTSSIKSVKFCQRILPIHKICSANMEEARKLATSLIAPVFRNTTECIEYCVVFDSRLNGSLDRMTVINMLADIVGPKHKVNLSNPTKVILVQLMKSFCGISIISNWTQYRKYNAQELLKQVLSSPNQNTKLAE
jgi:tRNA acetyltransferase TAN1